MLVGQTVGGVSRVANCRGEGGVSRVANCGGG